MPHGEIGAKSYTVEGQSRHAEPATVCMTPVTEGMEARCCFAGLYRRSLFHTLPEVVSVGGAGNAAAVLRHQKSRRNIK